MPWKVRDIVELREQFVLEALAPGANFSEVCRRYDISRKTGYKWKREYESKGRAGLSDDSRRPHRSPLRTTAEMTIEILKLRDAHPKWGPKIVEELLLRSHPKDDVPSERTIARILERAGRVAPRKRRCDRKSVPVVRPDASVEASNDLWTVDFKGWWQTSDKKRFEPLTIRDAHSRFVLLSKHLENTTSGSVRKSFEPIFERYGLPRAILVDNGSPFISVRALAGLTTLSAWWVSLGIRLVRSRLGCPQDNGGHERMHRTLAQGVEYDPAPNALLQQAKLDVWRHEFNHVRPHRALGMKTPAEVYKPSERPYAAEVEFEYEEAYATRKVAPTGTIGFQGSIYYLSKALRGHRVAIRRTDNGRHDVWFADHLLGTVSPNARKVLPVTA